MIPTDPLLAIAAVTIIFMVVSSILAQAETKPMHHINHKSTAPGDPEDMNKKDSTLPPRNGISSTTEESQGQVAQRPPPPPLKKNLISRVRNHLVTRVLVELTRVISQDSKLVANQIRHMIKPTLFDDGEGNFFCIVDDDGHFDSPSRDGTSLDPEAEPPMPKTMFCAHLDTVQTRFGPRVNTHHFFQEGGRYMLESREASQILGADDRTGCAILVWMIRNEVPGVYYFFRDEETGCVGSRAAMRTGSKFFAYFDRAIEFDRRGYTSVITEQSSGRTASDGFAQSLSSALVAADASEQKYLAGFSPDDTGIFTDTDQLASVIAEATNVSVGYFNAHSGLEYQDITFLVALADALLLVDWDALPTLRTPVPAYYGRSFSLQGDKESHADNYADLSDEELEALINFSTPSPTTESSDDSSESLTYGGDVIVPGESGPDAMTCGEFALLISKSIQAHPLEMLDWFTDHGMIGDFFDHICRDTVAWMGDGPRSTLALHLESKFLSNPYTSIKIVSDYGLIDDLMMETLNH